MKITFFIVAILFISNSLFAQKRMTNSAIINFDATTNSGALPKAENKTVIAAIDTKTGRIEFEVIVKNFSFSNPMMQEYFNGDMWLDSDKFPTSTFKGKITNLAAINFTKDGSYPAQVKGDLTIHGITNPVTTNGVLVVSGKAFSVTASFSVKLQDYGLTGKAIDVGKVAKEPKITVIANFK